MPGRDLDRYIIFINSGARCCAKPLQFAKLSSFVQMCCRYYNVIECLVYYVGLCTKFVEECTWKDTEY